MKPKSMQSSTQMSELSQEEMQGTHGGNPAAVGLVVLGAWMIWKAYEYYDENY